MAPLIKPPGFAGFTSVNAPRGSTPNDPEIIEIDDDDDEPMDDEEDMDSNEQDEEMEEEDEVDEDEEDNDSAGETNGINRDSESPLDFDPIPNGHKTFDMTTPELFTSAGAQQALHPLRRTADRVTRQIEAFAEKLDRFKQKENRNDEFENYQAAYQLVKSYQHIAQDSLEDISKQNTLWRAKMGWNTGRSNGTAAQDPKTQEELQRLQLEANTWQLLLNLISINDPPSRASAKQAQETAFQKLHRYSSDREIWEQFVGADHFALECVIIMKWLEHTSQSASQDIDSVISELEAQAERGQGLWTHGWLYTKETIKGQKRLRAWPQPLEPNDPAVTASLLVSEKSEPLITQLDPDAVTRQKQKLQKQDQFHERATWMTCWKMLRQGENWTRIRGWAESCLENWRAVSLCGSSVDANSSRGERTPIDDGTTRMMNWRSQTSWRNACSALARSQDTEDFQRAVYALLCGETEAAFKVCQSWDDYLYVYFNSVVLSRYQGFCKQFQRKLSHSPTIPVTFVPEPVGYADVNKFVLYTKGNDRVGVEARNPYRTIQAAILGKGYDSFFHSLAKAVSQAAASKGDLSFVPDLPPGPVDDSLLITAEDSDALRIATHLYIIANSLGYVRSDTQFLNTVSVNVIGYIANLEEAGIFDIIPLYASLLRTYQAHSVLGQILIEVVDPRERRQQVMLMENHGIDVEAVLRDQWQWVSASVSSVEHSRTLKRYPKVVRRKDGMPEVVPVKKDYIGTDISGLEERIIRSLEWLRFVDGQWGRICELGALLYRKFYVTGRLAAARELSRRMRLSDISRESFGFDVAEFPFGIEDGEEPPTPELSSPTKSRLFGSPHKRHRSATNRGPSDEQTSLLVQQSQTMRDLEELILAFDALEGFAVVCEKLDKNKRRCDSGTIKDLKDELQESLDEISVHIDALLDVWLMDAEDATEQAELEEIRKTYIPEVFLDYHNALYYAGHVLNSELLVQCMNLAMQVSENEYLTSAFVASRRMAELVDALALSSKAMVNTRAKAGKTLLGGESLGIWHVDVPEEDHDIHTVE
ncbi:107-domain-containing protein [Aspergillus coremiiformis]|uniref:Nuclear pore complex protein n=1 Tax=Aspergillus coremiiformis TaxID=138285 RepID=A0A5N6ZD50_9EURO|nr:107-domain-containing protein [Aspergillus coremiiformis]